MRNKKDASCITSGTMSGRLSKYLVCGAASALALAPLCAQAADTMKTDTTMTTTTTTVGTSAAATPAPAPVEPTAVSGTVAHYYVDRTGYVTAMDVQTANGLEMVHFPANRASAIYGMYPTGGKVDVWVLPSTNMGEHHWDAVGAGTDRPAVWWNVVKTTDVDWLSAEPYIDAGAKETSVSGNLKGIMTNQNGEILALALESSTGKVLVRVPPEVRQIAPDHRGDERITPLYKNAFVEVVGTPESARRGGLMAYNKYIAANSIRVDGDTVGAIGLPAMSKHRSDTILGWNVGGSINDNMVDKKQGRTGYMEYMPISNEGMTSAPAGTSTTTTTTTTSTSTEMATGRVMVVGADGSMMSVVKKGSKMYVTAADGTLTELKKQNGKYVVPATMAGARMMMVMADGSKMDMDTVNGQLMVKMADGSMAPVTLHTP
jgi:hypothetical protein